MAIFFLLFFSLVADAGLSITKIDKGSPNHFYLSDGRVTWTRDQRIAHRLESAHRTREELTLTLASNHEVIEVSAPVTNILIHPHGKLLGASDLFRPSIVPSLAVAQELLQRARYVEKESQCFNRAHVWASEWFSQFGLRSEKTFLFFTRKYIRAFNFGWWFHVAPSVRVIEGEEVRRRVLDRKYSRGIPQMVKQWTDVFMRNDAECLHIERYSDYANYPEAAWCYVLHAPMYIYQPLDLGEEELSGVSKSDWLPEELDKAYADAMALSVDLGLGVE